MHFKLQLRETAGMYFPAISMEKVVDLIPKFLSIDPLIPHFPALTRGLSCSTEQSTYDVSGIDQPGIFLKLKRSL